MKYKKCRVFELRGISMQAMPLRIVLILTILFLFNPSSLLVAMDQRTALVIGNSSYNTGPLTNPANDATDMAATLQKLGFKVILKKDVDLETMESVIEDFGNLLKRGGGRSFLLCRPWCPG
jgi:hypothetical protein